MTDLIECFIKIFADNTKGLNQITSIEDSAVLGFLDNLYCWNVDWGVAFICGKCGVLHLGKNNPNHNYTINNIQLKVKETPLEKDLGSSCGPLLNFE